MHRHLLLLLLLTQVLAHSWNEQLIVVVDRKFTGRNGYPRGYVSRGEPGFSDRMMTYLLPPSDSGRMRVTDIDLLCAPTQRTSNQTMQYPRLKVSPGSYVAMKYLENGHVTLPQSPPGKPVRAGTVYVFGTSQPSGSELLTSVFQWTGDGSGGDRRGKLLTAQSFDDGRCYQINGDSISLARQKQFPNPVHGQPGSIHEQWCETDIMIPKDLQKWPTSPGVLGLPKGKDEYYITCSDLEVIIELIDDGMPNPLFVQDPQMDAVPDYRTRATCAGETPVP
ncbi:hypothetical protein F4778DRAFT_769909 [Xylariomycetidae sp. FL2044]|nr:hypothetical protein F4778DRAFT_769909 [Xylariomycetidae sp. FL2044]